MIRYAAILLASAAVPLGAPAFATSHVAAEDDAARLNIWFDEKFEEWLTFSPLTQTALGRKTDYDKIDDYSVAGADAEVNWWRDAAAEMRANFEYDSLPADAQLSWHMFLFRVAEAEAAARYRSQEYVLEQTTAMHAEIPSIVISQHAVDTESDMVAFIARIGGIGTAMSQLLERAHANAVAGSRPPVFAYDGVIEESRKLISGAPFDDGPLNALWEASEGHLAKLVADGAISRHRAAQLREDARWALTKEMAPQYERLIAWFTADRPNAPTYTPGAYDLKDGEAYYAHRLKAMTTTDLSADDIHNIGLSEVARIRGEMEAIRQAVGFDGSLADFFTFMREDDRFFFSDDDAGADQYIAAAEAHLAAINQKLPQYFGRLPKADLVVKRVEPFREQDGAAQHYRQGTPDGSRPGIYYAHLSDMRAMPIPPLEVIAYHEGNPGHHMQVSIGQELEGVPKFRSQGEYIPAFGEGWALYSEKLAKEMGAYEDPYSDFGRLTTEIWRAIRLVVDTGIHSKDWSEQQAVDYFLANSPMPETTVRSEVRRYIVWPGQATAYKIGMIRIQELRARAEQELGEEFDIRGFHDAVLGGGDVPLSILEKQVDMWIASVKAGS
ncbi:DUF885 domain-containing protein [Sphingomicrobium flavum]|uniref:DUF885 domain-containing protein n=1 Tax=Sphingomicrobium flavum TaxID=1229164 RepID=UPI0021ADF83E|nr:DUF885 domain-containing protein [Sphingomicrobium flavum]